MLKIILSLFLIIGVVFARKVKLHEGDYSRDEINATVIDYGTNLMWQDNTEVKTTTRNWNDSITYCEELNLDGYTNWKLPNYNELFSISDKTRGNPAINDKFINTNNNYYWSSSTYHKDSTKAWVINFNDATDSASSKTTATYYVRCVREE